MRTFFIMLLGSWALGAGCDEAPQSNYYDLGVQTTKHLGDPCSPDIPPRSQCGFAPQFYCTAGGICASACNTDADCGDGARCVGSGDMMVGECRLPASPSDGGHD